MLVPPGTICQWLAKHEEVLESIASTIKLGGKADSTEAIVIELLELGLDVMLGVMEGDGERERERAREAQARQG
jgi:hypothetical protein